MSRPAGQLGQAARRTLVRAGTLIVGEPEDLVLDGRPAHGIAELVTLQDGHAGIEEAFGIQVVVPDEIERGTVETVGTRLGDGVHHGAAEAAVLGIEAVGDQVKLGDGVQVRDDLRAEVQARLSQLPAASARPAPKMPSTGAAPIPRGAISIRVPANVPWT